MKNLTINVGDYVRTKCGSIFKIIGGNEDNWDLDISFGYLETFEEEWLELYRYNDNYSFFNNKNILKSSPNIIDLIVVGDVLLTDISPDDCGGIVVLRSVETENDIKRYKSKFENKEYILKGIITHEQIESMVYKIER